MDSAFPAPYCCVRSNTAFSTDAGAFFEEPNPHLKAEISAGECANWTDVDGVKGIIVIKFLVRMASQG